MEIILNEQKDGLKTHVYLMDGDKIIEFKTSLSDHLVKDFIINLIIRYSLSKNALIRDNQNTITLDEYIKTTF